MNTIPLFKVFMPAEVDAAILDTLHSGYLAEGERVIEFRSVMQKFIGSEYVVPMNSCTTALTIAYDLAGIGQGDEVITVPLTSVCTNMPFVHRGAHIVWGDVEKETGMLDPKILPQLITKKTKAIVVLHKDGDLAKMDEILEIARAHNVRVIEDAAHALGASYRGRNVGTIGDFTCFSFQAIKHITTGDGGILTCAREDDYKDAKKLKWLGLDKEELAPGVNPWEQNISLKSYKGNMNDISASLGIVAMKHIDEILATYRRNGELYTKLLSDVPGVSLIERDPGSVSSYWTYVVLLEKREAVMAALKEHGIASSHVHPRNDVYSIFSEFKRPLPGVDYFSERELSLPCGWWVTEADVERIVDVIRKTV